MIQGFDELAKLLDEHEFFSKMKNSDKITLALLFTEVFKQGAASRQPEIDESQKRLAMYERQGYKLVPVEPNEKQWGGLSRHLGRYMQMNDRYCPKTLKKYFDRFIGEPPQWLTKEVGNWDSEHAFATADLPVFIYKAMIGVVE